MRAIRNFEEFIKEGTIKIVTPDRPRAEFLIREANQEYETMLELFGSNINDKIANILVKSCYDILMEIIRAKMFLKGYNATGKSAHESEVSYLRIIGISENDIQFIDQMRYFRNGMLYYGTIVDKIYAEKVLEFTKRIYIKLKESIKIQ
ncbi:MAG: hypothetical protein KJ697_01680 [Nanoarchaeota archaeon]|nr:hypothetical protein [Nanoarchaeota archaeon]